MNRSGLLHLVFVPVPFDRFQKEEKKADQAGENRGGGGKNIGPGNVHSIIPVDGVFFFLINRT
jgi:hypothetical protein